jgi:hypothetical protein
MAEKKEPMIGQESRPTAIDFDMPIANFTLRDLYAVMQSQIHLAQEHLKTEKEHFKESLKPEHTKEFIKPEKEKEILKVEKEILKGEKEKEILKGEKEKEFQKPEKEFAKPEKEALKPEKELSKPEKQIDVPGLVEQVAVRVIEKLRGQGLIK